MKKLLQILAAVILLPCVQTLSANVGLVKDSVSNICEQLIHFSNTSNTYAGVSSGGTNTLADVLDKGNVPSGSNAVDIGSAVLPIKDFYLGTTLQGQDASGYLNNLVASNRLGIGTSPSYQYHQYFNYPSFSGAYGHPWKLEGNYTPTGNLGDLWANECEIDFYGSYNYGTVKNWFVTTYHMGSGYMAGCISVEGYVATWGGASSSLKDAIGVNSYIECGSGTITNAYGVYSDVYNYGGTVHNAYGFYTGPTFGSGAINKYNYYFNNTYPSLTKGDLIARGIYILNAGGYTSFVATASSALANHANTVAGNLAGASLAGGINNVFYGNSAGNATASGNFNVAVGNSALSKNVSGGVNTAIGDAALRDSVSLNYNTAIGGGALKYLVTGSDNVAVGPNVMGDATNVSSCTAVGGSETMRNIRQGTRNTAIGQGALRYIYTNNNYNTALGYAAGYGLSYSTVSYSGGHNHNTAIGYNSQASAQKGSYNTSLGSESMSGASYFDAGVSNTYLGYRAGYGAGTLTNAIAIGTAVVPSDSHQIAIGNSAHTKTILRSVEFDTVTDAGTMMSISNNYVAVGNEAAALTKSTVEFAQFRHSVPTSTMPRNVVFTGKFNSLSSSPGWLGIAAYLGCITNYTTAYGTINLASLYDGTNTGVGIFTNNVIYANFYRLDTAVNYVGRTENAYSLAVGNPSMLGAVPNNMFGLSIGNQGKAGMSAAYGLRVSTQAGATDNWGLYLDGGKHLLSGTNYFDDVVLPVTSNTVDIGSSLLPFQNLYAGNLLLNGYIKNPVTSGLTIGDGTGNPAVDITASGTGYPGVKFIQGSTMRGRLQYHNAYGSLRFDSGSKYVFSDGNVGIKNESPAYELDVTGRANITSNLVVGGSVTLGGEPRTKWIPATRTVTLAFQDMTNGLAYWNANPFGTNSCTLVSVFVKSHGATGTVDLVSQHRSSSWYTYDTLQSGITLDSTGTEQTSFSGSTAITNGMRIGVLFDKLSAFAGTNMASADITVSYP